MPAFNAAGTISDSINSILAQSYQDFQIYIIDDCSNDNTVEVIKSFNSSKITLHENIRNLGVAQSRNIGIELAKGEYIAFLDSDDIWLESKLYEQAIMFDSFDVICSGYYFFRTYPDVDGLIQPKSIITYKDMLKSNFIGNLTGIYNAKKLGKVYQKSRGHEDYIMWLDILLRVEKAYCIQKPLAMYRVSSNSLSGNKVKAMGWQWNIYRQSLGFGFLKSAYFFVLYLYNAISKRAKNKK